MVVTGTKKLEKRLKKALTYEEWLETAEEIDRKTRADRWRVIDQSRRYDYVSIRQRVDRLRVMRARLDNKGLLFALNEGIHGNMGGMGNQSLYQRAVAGTKQLIADYVDEICDALEYLASDRVEDISFERKLDFFRRAQHCFGSSALMMSGSGTLLYFHVGVVKTLTEHDLLPGVMSGSSGGSFVGGLICTRTQQERLALFEPEQLVFEVKEYEKRYGWVQNRLQSMKIARLGVDEVREVIDRYVPDLTFQEAYEKTGLHLNISIAPAETHQTSRLLNAMTSPNVFIRDAIMASAAVPGVYPPVTLAAKNDHGERQAYLPSRKWVDGSVSDDLPAKRLARLYGVNHYIVSQTNPHVIPFVTDSKRKSDPLSQIKYAGVSTARAWLNAGHEMLRRPLAMSESLTRAANIALSVVNQDYIGDINILPEERLVNPMKVLSHLPIDEVSKLILMGERATWPKLEMIRVQTKVGRTLERILHDYEHKFAQNAAQAIDRKRGKHLRQVSNGSEGQAAS